MNRVSCFPPLLGAIVCLFTSLFFFPPHAQATFPALEIALWDSHFAKEDRSNPEYLKVLELAKNKKFGEALTIVEGLSGAYPEKGTPKILKSLLLYELGRYVDSYKALQEARNIQPRHPAVHFIHCELYRELGVVALAERSCAIAVDQHPDQADAFFERALTLSAAGEMEKANGALEQAAELAPANADYPFQMGLNFNYLGDTGKAIQAFRKTLELNPNHLEAAYQLGYAYATQNDMKLAEQYLNQVYDTRLDDPQVEEARVLLEFLKTNGPSKLPSRVEPAQYHRARSQKLYQQGTYGLSLFEIQTAARLAPQDLAIQQILIGLSSLLLRLEVTEQAVQHFLEISGDNKDLKAKGYQELGDLYVMRGNMPKAKEYYEQALKLGDPGDISKTSLEELPAAGAIPRIDFTEPWFLNPPEALNQKGEVFAHYGMYKRAVNLYSMALRMDPNNLISKLDTAMAYYKSEQFNRAIAILEKTLVSHPNHSHIFSHRILLAKAYAQAGNDSEAVDNLKKAKEINPAKMAVLKTDPVLKRFAGETVFQ
ncbi:MAG: tetratricopeptide repeat protein [Nitrospina sp.]|nr:tetratricopeptide repeat protein [Nitrospina sp.]